MVKAFIISEAIFWSAWNFIMPIFAVFATNEVDGGSIQVAASSVSVYLVVRIIFELISGRYLLHTSNYKKFFITIAGTLIVSFGFLGFALTHTISLLFIFYSVIGLGIGLASPAKNSLFSTHLDKDKETTEWGIYDAAVFVGMALSAALGGFIAKIYGFQILFLICAALNSVCIIPYLLYMGHFKKYSSSVSL